MTAPFRARSARRLSLALGGSLAAIVAANPVIAQTVPTCVNTAGICQLTNTGTSGAITLTSPARLQNSGAISGTIGVTGVIATQPIGQPTLTTVLIDNRAGGSITGTGGTAVQAMNSTLINAGSITGNVTGPSLYVADGGTITGNLTLGSGVAQDFGTQTFVQRNPNLGISGTISAGNGIDTYARSYSSSTAVTLGAAALPTTFEVEGFEARGASTVVTVSAPSSAAVTGYSILGDGAFVNKATVNPISTAGANFPTGTTIYTTAINYLGVPETSQLIVLRAQIPGTNPSLPNTVITYNLPIHAALTSFTNDGTVNGDIRVSTGSFINTGAINLVSQATGTLILAKESADFTFRNSGTISYTDNGARPTNTLAANEGQYLGDEGFQSAIRVRSLLGDGSGAGRVENSGQITGGASFNLRNKTVVFENTGSIAGIVGQNVFANGVTLDVGGSSDVLGTSEVKADSVTFTNAARASISQGVFIEAVAETLSFTNAGTISGAAGENRAISIDHYGLENANGVSGDVTSFAFGNSGTVTGDVVLNTGAKTNTLTNSGTITMPAVTGFIPDRFYSEAVEVEVDTAAANSVNFTNTGKIIQNNRAATALSFEMSTHNTGANSTITLTNSGEIRSDAGATVVNPPFTGSTTLTHLNPSIAVEFDVNDVAGTATINLNNQAGGIISAVGTPTVVTPTTSTPTTISSLSAAIVSNGGVVNITNAGTISGSANFATPNSTSIIPNTDVNVYPEGYLGGAIHTINSIDHVINTATGVINGSVALNGGNDIFENYGALNGSVRLGLGDDIFIFGLKTGTITGTVDGGPGNDTLSFDITDSDGLVSEALLAHFTGFEKQTLIGTGKVVTTNTVQVTPGGSLNLASGSEINKPGATAIDGSGTQAVAVTNSGTVTGNVVLGSGDNQFANQGSVTGNVTTGNGNNNVTNTGTITGTVTAGTGSDTFTNTGTINGSVDLGGGTDHYVIGQGTVTGQVDGGDGIDSIDINFGRTGSGFHEQATVNSVALNPTTIGNVVNFELVTVNGPGTVVASGSLPVGTVQLNAASLVVDAGTTFGTTGPVSVTGSAGAESVTVNGTMSGGVALGDGADLLTVGGRITGAVDLGAGNDTLTINSGASFGSTVSGGAGTDALVFTTAGTDTTPTEIAGGTFTGFETLTNSGGTAAVSGTLALNTIAVTGGRLIGRTGSTLTGAVTVSSGATFGSAGTVNGSITVATGGTLSPGASPGVMTVNGNVSLASGTTSVFEFVPSPGQSDQLVITGGLTIASGASLNLTGNRPLTPGVAYSLITTTTGINGTFTTVNQASTVAGFLRYTANELQLLGTFVVPTGASAQATAGVNYVNSVLTSGGASTALLAAVPSLLSGSTANAAAFVQLTPEVYASASQLSVEHGLAIGKAVRGGLGETSRPETGAFAFAQGMGDWRRIAGNATTGVSEVENKTYGVLGGVGYGSASGSIAGYVGNLSGDQRIAGLGAKTKTNGLVAGVIGRMATGGFDAALSLSYDWSKADTARAVPGATVTSRYNLHAFIADGNMGYAVPLSAAWSVRPSIGLTYVDAKRDAAVESGSAAFAMTVQARNAHATFINGGLTFKGGLAGVRPWVQLGVRHQLNGEGSLATGGFTGSTVTISSLGVTRTRTVATFGAGASVDLAPNLELYGAYAGETGPGRSHNVNLGIRFGF